MPDALLLLVGTYTAEGAEGIYASDFDPADGSLTTPRCIALTAQPSYLAVASHHRFLYAVNELWSPDGLAGGSVTAYALDVRAGRLAFLNSRPSGGGAPCHVACHPGGKWVAAANYASGTAAVFPVREDGSLGEAARVVRLGTRARNGVVQVPHAHSLVFGPGGDAAYVADLGTDRLHLFRFDARTGNLTADAPFALALPDGAGPRSLALHPDGRHACLVNERGSTLALLDLAPAAGGPQVLRVVSTLPRGWTGESHGADVHIHPGGAFAYCSNRGHDSIAVFSLEDQTLSLVGHVSTAGAWPRSFCLDPQGRWLVVANQHSHSLTCFSVDPASGLPRLASAPITLMAPAFVTLVNRAG